MKKCAILMILLFLFNEAFANVALDELNGLIQQKKISSIQKNDEQLQDLQKNYYFIFIFSSTCPHCHKFAPILKDFTSNFDLEVEAYSVDGLSLAEFKEAKPVTPQLFQTLYASGHYKPAVPALFLVNRHTLEAYAVLFGEAQPAQLSLRINELMQHIQERFHA